MLDRDADRSAKRSRQLCWLSSQRLVYLWLVAGGTAWGSSTSCRAAVERAEDPDVAAGLHDQLAEGQLGVGAREVPIPGEPVRAHRPRLCVVRRVVIPGAARLPPVLERPALVVGGRNGKNSRRCGAGCTSLSSDADLGHLRAAFPLPPHLDGHPSSLVGCWTGRRTDLVMPSPALFLRVDAVEVVGAPPDDLGALLVRPGPRQIVVLLPAPSRGSSDPNIMRSALPVIRSHSPATSMLAPGPSRERWTKGTWSAR